MRVVKQFGYAHISFDGSDRALNMLTAIHGAISKRGYGIVLPEVGNEDTYSVPGIGRVKVERSSDLTCKVEVLASALDTRISHLFGS